MTDLPNDPRVLMEALVANTIGPQVDELFKQAVDIIVRNEANLIQFKILNHAGDRARLVCAVLAALSSAHQTWEFPNGVDINA